MSTFIRVKRRHDQDPTDLLLINCKKRKFLEGESSSKDIEPAIFNLAHTTTKKDEDLNIKTSAFEAKYKNDFCLEKVKQRIRNEFEAQQKENRYKVVNMSRTNENNTLYDLEDIEENKSSEANYVYDVYYNQDQSFGEILKEDLVNVYALDNELIYGSYRDNGGLEAEDTDSSDDSNAENNWRNDYPDEDYDKDSITNDHMLRAMMDGGLDLSSDDEGCREGFIYSIDSEAAGFEEDIDESDVNRYGERYAMFKAMNKSASEYDHEYSSDED